MNEYRFRATYKDRFGNVTGHTTFTVLAANRTEAEDAADDHAEHTVSAEEYRSYRLRYLGVAD